MSIPELDFLLRHLLLFFHQNKGHFWYVTKIQVVPLMITKKLTELQHVFSFLGGAMLYVN